MSNADQTKEAPPVANPKPVVEHPPLGLGDLKHFVKLGPSKIDGIYVSRIPIGDAVHLMGFRGIVLGTWEDQNVVLRVTSTILARAVDAETFVETKLGDLLFVRAPALVPFAPRVDYTGEHVFEVSFLPPNDLRARRLHAAEIAAHRLDGAGALLVPGGMVRPSNLDKAIKAAPKLSASEAGLR